jgi:hypothetical protein
MAIIVRCLRKHHSMRTHIQKTSSRDMPLAYEISTRSAIPTISVPRNSGDVRTHPASKRDTKSRPAYFDNYQEQTREYTTPAEKPNFATRQGVPVGDVSGNRSATFADIPSTDSSHSTVAGEDARADAYSHTPHPVIPMIFTKSASTIHVEIDGATIKILLDSGADINVLSSSFYQQHVKDRPITPAPIPHALGANGTVLTCIQILGTLTITVQSTVLSTQ